MYTVYVNDSPLRIAAAAPAERPELTLRYNGKSKFLLQVIGTLEGGRHPQGALVLTDDPDTCWRELHRLFTIVLAAGGAVINDGRLLCIYRRGSWDLPKGKIDDDEGQEEAALREVTEETGLTELKLGRELPTTYHTYRDRKGGRILKPTYWYEMSTQQETLVPQVEEDIERAEWVQIDRLAEVRAGMYASLWPVIDEIAGM